MFVKRYGAGRVPCLAISGGRITQEALDSKMVQPFFSSFPLIGFKSSLVRQLNQQEYKLTNSDDLPDSFTIVYLMAGPEQLFASVELAVDGDLEPVVANADHRESEAKGGAVRRLLAASNLGEVLPGPGSLKIVFCNLSSRKLILTEQECVNFLI
jgi:hypothetical protein